MSIRWRYPVVILGIILIVIAILPDLQSFNRLGPIQNFLLMVGLALLAAGLLQRRITRLYSCAGVLLLNTVLLFVILDVLVGVINVGLGRIESMRGLSDDAANELLKRDHPYYRDQPWSDALWGETNRLELEYHPFVLWREKPQTGNYVNVSPDSIRPIPNTHCDTANPYRIFLFGGSTMFGIGAPDDMTIGAYLQDDIQTESNRDICIVNYASSGWVSTQSVIQLIRQLQVGNIPDMVIFYDGYNDSLAAANSGIPNGEYSGGDVASRFNNQGRQPELRDWLLSSSNIGQTLKDLFPAKPPVESYPPHIKVPITDIDRLAEATANTYFANYRAVESLSNEYEFQFAFFWQPALAMGDKQLTPTEVELVALYAEKQPVFEAVYKQVKEASSNYSALNDLTDAFREITETLYSDTIHITPVGNAIIAQRIVDFLMPQIREYIG